MSNRIAEEAALSRRDHDSLDRDYLTCAETAKLVRAALKAAFPSVKFSVRSSVYSMGASISIAWTDGPTEQEVNAVADHYQGVDFDGMTDSTIHRPAILVNGRLVRSGAHYIHGHRQISREDVRVEAATAWLREQCSVDSRDRFGGYDVVDIARRLVRQARVGEEIADAFNRIEVLREVA